MRFIKEVDLETMCLNVIIDNIYRFVLLKSKWDEENDEKHVLIEFLRNIYPDALHKGLRKRRTIIDCKLINFLLSPGWRRVRLYTCHASHPSLFTRLKDIGPGIKFLTLKNILVSPSILNAIICCVPNVAYLNLSSTYCDNSNLYFISKTCKKLEILNMFECNITNAGIAAIIRDLNQTDFKCLQALNLERTHVNEKSLVSILKHLKSLVYLNWSDLSIYVLLDYLDGMITEEDRFNLKQFAFKRSSGTSINLLGQTVMDVIKLWAKICPQVMRISVYETIDQRLVESLSSFEQLKVLELYNSDAHFLRAPHLLFTDSEFFKLRASQLTEINLHFIVISLKALLDLCVNLKSLSLHTVSFSDEDLPTAYMNEVKLSKLESLTVLHCGSYQPLKKLLHFTRNLTKLAILYSVNFDKDVVSCILELANLTVVDLSNTDVKPDMLLGLLASVKIQVILTNLCPYISNVCGPIRKYVNKNPHGNTCGWKLESESDFLLNHGKELAGLTWFNDQVLCDEILGESLSS